MARVSSACERMKKVFCLCIFIDKANVGSKRWRPPQVDEDWHAFCLAIFEGIEGPEWEAMYYRYKDLHQAVKKARHREEH